MTLSYALLGVALALAACDAFTGPANPAVTRCGGHCDCGAAGCCDVAQIDCAGVECLPAGALSENGKPGARARSPATGSGRPTKTRRGSDRSRTPEPTATDGPDRRLHYLRSGDRGVDADAGAARDAASLRRRGHGEGDRRGPPARAPAPRRARPPTPTATRGAAATRRTRTTFHDETGDRKREGREHRGGPRLREGGPRARGLEGALPGRGAKARRIAPRYNTGARRGGRDGKGRARELRPFELYSFTARPDWELFSARIGRTDFVRFGGEITTKETFSFNLKRFEGIVLRREAPRGARGPGRSVHAELPQAGPSLASVTANAATTPAQPPRPLVPEACKGPLEGDARVCVAFPAGRGHAFAHRAVTTSSSSSPARASR